MQKEINPGTAEALGINRNILFLAKTYFCLSVEEVSQPDSQEMSSANCLDVHIVWRNSLYVMLPRQWCYYTTVFAIQICRTKDWHHNAPVPEPVCSRRKIIVPIFV